MRSNPLLGIVGCMIVAWGCSNADSGQSENGLGSLRVALDLSSVEHDVTAVRIDLVAPDQTCDSPALASKTVSLESEQLPASLAGSGSHPFADGLFILEPGSYRVCATPLAGDAPSAECDPTNSVAQVTAAFTAEVVLYSQCRGDATGGLDVAVGLNDPPKITSLTINPSKFISVCESAAISAMASDPNGDDLSYQWSVFSGSDASKLSSDGANATFSGPAGDYVLNLTVDDGHGATTFLDFPIHVSDAVCAVPQAVQDIFTARCTPCHTVGSSGGLHLDPATASYANLVGQAAVGAGCTSQTRVVPGDAASSYLIAKLRGSPGICGLQMPRNRPPLPEEEIATIEAWINGLPH